MAKLGKVLGDLATISAVEEGTDVSPYSITLSLSLLDSTLAEQALRRKLLHATSDHIPWCVGRE